jgi:hypothetical protein
MPRTPAPHMNVSPGSCVICLEDDDDVDIIELCEHGTYTTQQGTQKHHGVCTNCFPRYVRNYPWNCATCRRSYGPKFEHHRAIAFGEAAEGSLPQAEPSWMSAPLVSVADLHERTAPQLDPMFQDVESEPAGGFMDHNEAFNFGRLRAAMVRRPGSPPVQISTRIRQPPEASSALDEGFNFGRLRAAMDRRREQSVAMASSPPLPPPAPEPAPLDEAFNFGRLRNAMRRRGNFDDL